MTVSPSIWSKIALSVTTDIYILPTSSILSIYLITCLVSFLCSQTWYFQAENWKCEHTFIKLFNQNFRTSDIQEKWSSFKERIRQWKWAIIQPQFQSSSELGLRTENFDDTVSRRFYASSWSRSRAGLKLRQKGCWSHVSVVVFLCNKYRQFLKKHLIVTKE